MEAARRHTPSHSASHARPLPIAREEYRERQRAVAGDARERGLDGLLVWSACGSALDGYANVFYLTNHYSQVPRVDLNIPPAMSGWGHTALVVPADGEPPILVVESAEWRPDLVVAERVWPSHDMHAEVVRAVDEAGLGSGQLGLVGAPVMPLAAWQRISAALPRAGFEPADDLLFARRMRKSPGEVELMRYASAVGAAMQNAMLAAIGPGATDNDLARVAYDVCCDYGAVPYGFAFASGPNSGHGYWGRLPSWDRERRYIEGDIVHPDVYGSVDGYFFDVQRTRIVGSRPSARQRRLLDGAVEVVEALCGACRAGESVAFVARLRDEWLAEHGFAEPPSAPGAPASDSLMPIAASGHGLGLGFELPWVLPTDGHVLESGMTISLEVYVSDPEIGTVVNEEVVLVTDGEPEFLTSGCPARDW
jgi:Xaa-Pro aminopeptidase